MHTYIYTYKQILYSTTQYEIIPPGQPVHNWLPVPACLYTLHTYIYPYKHTYIYTYIYTYKHTGILKKNFLSVVYINHFSQFDLEWFLSWRVRISVSSGYIFSPKIVDLRSFLWKIFFIRFLFAGRLLFNGPDIEW